MIRILGVLGLVMLGLGDAYACTIKAGDLKQRLSAAFRITSIGVEESKDARSGEPVRSYLVNIHGKGMLTVTQRHCEIHNLEFSFVPHDSASNEPGIDLILRAAVQTPTWQEYFSHINAEAVVQTLELHSRVTEVVTLGLDDVIWARSASSEALLEWTNVTDTEASRSLTPTLYLSVGGL